MRKLLIPACAAVLALAAAPVSKAETPWFAGSVDDSSQVISVVGTGDSSATVDVWQRTAADWEPIAVDLPAFIGENGMAEEVHDGALKTPTGVFTLDYAFGTAPNPGGGLKYVQTGPDHWWDGDWESPTYNTMQVCDEEQCPFDTAPDSFTENLEIPQYVHAVVMGVNKARVPGNGGAFFLHATDGEPTGGCVAIDDATLVQIIRWLRPGAMIAITT